MELPSLSEIKRYRKRLGITQTELSKKAGISQSLIARVEAGNVDPRYSKIEKIFRALNELKREEIKAREIMSKRIVGVDIDDSLSRAVELMRNYDVSQLPVFRKNRVVGSISEDVILTQISRGVDVRNMASKSVENFMEESFPSVNLNTPLSTISKLLENNKAVLVIEKGEIEGIITNADLLKVLR